ncbi:MAG: DUF4350 domain-containing protein [Candidatus Methanofastidiosia archaeon]
MKLAQLFILIVFVVGIVSVATIAERSSTPVTAHSSKDPGEMGTLAFYLLMEKYTHVERIENTIERLDPGTLLLMYPARPLAPEEKEYVLSWVKEGNRLIIFSESPEIVKDLGASISSTQKKLVSITPNDHWSTTEVAMVSVIYQYHINTSRATVILADDDNILAAEVPYGSGELVVITATSLVENIFIDHLDNEIFLVRLSLSQNVYFDEYHLHQIEQSQGITLSKLKSTFSSKYSSFFVQLVIVITVFMVSYGKRFGKPRPPLTRGVQSSQLVTSAAELYYRAQKEEILDLIKAQSPPIHTYKNSDTKP